MSLILNGSSQYAYRTTLVTPTNRPFTVSAFFKSTSDSALQALYAISVGDDTDDYYRLGIRGNVVGDPVGCYVKRTIAPYGTAITSSGYTANTWHHAAYVEVGAQNRRVFIDGGSKGIDVTNSVTPELVSPTVCVGAMKYNGDWANYFVGKICRVAVWNLALLDAEIALLANGTDPSLIQADNLKAYWLLYNDAVDSVAGLYDLTLVGTPSFDEDDSPSRSVSAAKRYRKHLLQG